MIETIYNCWQVAYALGVKPKTVQKWVQAGRLQPLHFGRSARSRIRISETELKKFLGLTPEQKEPVPEVPALVLGTVLSDRERFEQTQKEMKAFVDSRRRR